MKSWGCGGPVGGPVREGVPWGSCQGVGGDWGVVGLAPNDSYAFTDLEKVNLQNNYFCSISTINDSNINLPEFNKRTESLLANFAHRHIRGHRCS